MKKKYPIEYLPTAENDLQEVIDYFIRESSHRAAHFLKEVDKKISRLAFFPLSGFIPRDAWLIRKKYRIVLVQNHLVFYRFEKGKVIIHRVLHGKRQYAFLL